MKKPINIGRWCFESLTAAIRHIRALMARYGNEQPIAGDDAEFVAALFQRHLRYEQKVTAFSAPFSHFAVSANKGGTRCFYVVLANGKLEDFSYKHCL